MLPAETEQFIKKAKKKGLEYSAANLRPPIFIVAPTYQEEELETN
jgi:hypothetical protein